MKTFCTGAGAPLSTSTVNTSESEKKSINLELWQACGGPLVNLPMAGTHVVYFPQGHSEQVAASMKKDADAQIPNYPNLPSKLLCLLCSVTLHADPETDEVYAQMTLQPVPSFDKEALLRSDLSMKQNKQQPEFFCKILTASDTNTHGGFSVPRRAAEKIFPPLDFTMQPPAKELVARDLHDNVWTFRHVYRGQPKRHLLTTGWSLFVGGKRLFAGDSVLFIRDEKHQLLLGIRRANRQPVNLSSSVLSSDSMHIGILAAAAHAAANNSPFTVFYNPRASPSEFVVPLAKYYKAACNNQVSMGMRFRMMFETEESGTGRYMGTITGISDLDPMRWKNSEWRNLQVNWDESTGGDKRDRVSIWEIEPVTAPFFICPTSSSLGLKRPRLPGVPDDDYTDLDTMLKRTMPWLGDDFGVKDPSALSGLSLIQWMNMQQNSSLGNNPNQSNYLNSISGLGLQNLAGIYLCHQPGFLEAQASQQPLNINQQQQPSHPFQRNLAMNMQSSQSQLQQQILSQSQHQNPIAMQTSDLVSQQLSSYDSQIQLQLVQNIQHQQQQQQQQMYLAQQSRNSSQNITRSNEPFEQLKLQQQNGVHAGDNLTPTNLVPTGRNRLLTRAAGGEQSGITDEIQSCSASPSTNNCPGLVHPFVNNRIHRFSQLGDETNQVLGTNGLKTVSSSSNVCHDLQQNSDVKSSFNVSNNPNQGCFSQHTYPNASGAQIDYLDSSSSATSICISQNDSHLPQYTDKTCFDSQPVLFRDISQEIHDNVVFGSNLRSNQFGMPVMNDSVMTGRDFLHDPTSARGMLSSYENPNDSQPELSSSMASQSFSVPDIFKARDSAVADTSFINGGSWVTAQQMPRIRTYTKVYKRGAVGRSIDITRYSGYEELKQDLARRFGIEGQVEDQQRIGWKLVYVDNENDVLLVGDDPWEEFVSCVRCIKILSPQEVQQMSLDGDFGNNLISNQACSSSDCRNAALLG